MRRWKRKISSKLSMRLFFSLFFIVALVAINAAAAVIISLLGRAIPLLHRLPGFVWLLIISAVLGSGITALLVAFFFDPITKLGNAMRRVAQGDFDVTLDTRHTFREVRQINQDFNLMTKELGSTEILKTEFVSNVSHEFKTPINAIEGYATLLQDTDLSRDQQQMYVEKILLNTGRLSKLVGNILLLSKVDNQQIQPHVTTYRLDEQIRQSILALEPLWTKKDNGFDVDLERVEFTGSENLLMHVWNNLIENAIKYGPDRGVIAMKLVQRDQTAVFTIDDEGPGIRPEDRQHIFDRFYQADSSRKTEGNGLGLALVKQILTISGGTIRVDPLPVKGTRFTVTLPME